MAFIRSLSTRANLLTRRCHSSIGYILRHHHRDHHDDTKPDSIQKTPLRALGTTGFTNSSLLGSRCFDFSVSPTIGASFYRKMSTSTGEGTENSETMSDVVEVLSDSTVQSIASQAPPAVNEVAIAAADSVFPVALLQHFIDAVHSFTGFNWWASIVLATLAVRGAGLPLTLCLLKDRFKEYPRVLIWEQGVKEIYQKVKYGGLDRNDATEQILRHSDEHGIFMSTIKPYFIKALSFVCFFFAISNMAEKVPSFKTGGAYWFLDLSTPDSLYIFPVLTALTFLISEAVKLPEINKDMKDIVKEYKDLTDFGPLIKRTNWGLAVNALLLTVLFVPLTMGLPKAILCFWITSNIFSSAFNLALRHPRVKKLIGYDREMFERMRSQLNGGIRRKKT